jgi:D-psicose/D-tagatose/L-ribulose 3-epimerase
MKFGANAFIWSDRFGRSQLPLLDTLKQNSFDGVELPLLDPKAANDPEIKSALQSIGLEVTFCSVLPSGLRLGDDSPDVRSRARDHISQCIQTAAAMGGHLIGGPLYSPVGYLPGRRRTPDEWSRVVESYQHLGPELDAADVTIAIEPLNRYETYFLNTAEDAAALCGKINHPRVGILFDTYHANVEEKSVAKSIVQAGHYIRHFHSCENDRGIPGTGHIDWPSVVQALRSIRYDGWLTIEGFGFSLGALSAAASIWRDLAPKPDAIALKGIQFLRKALAN